MVLDFTEWILKRKQSKVGTSGAGAKSQSVDLGGILGKVQLFQSSPALLQQITTLDRVQVNPIEAKLVSNVTVWAEQDESARREVVRKLVAVLEEAVNKQQGANWKEAPESVSKVKATLRLATLKNQITSSSPVERFLPGATYSLVLSSTYPSLLALSNQLVPYLLSGIALTLVSNADTSGQVAYLVDLLVDLGLPAGVLTQLIDFSVGNAGQIVSYILLDDADIHSALDAALSSQLIYGIASVKIFAQDSLKATVQQVLSHILEIQYRNDNELFSENELLSQARQQVKVNSDAVNIETDASGLEVFYYRTTSEALKLVNFLQGPVLRQQWVSIWSKNSSQALRVAQGVSSAKQVVINGSVPTVTGYNSLGGWQFELIGSSPLSRLVADNAELALKSPLSKSWSSSVATRVRTVHSLLDSLKLANGTAVRLALQQTLKEVDEDSTVNTLWLAYYEPIGEIIIQLAPTDVDDTCLLAFGLNAILFGNSLVLVGKSSSKQLATWKKVQDFLEAKGFAGAVQTVASDKDVKVEGVSTSQGALQLVGGVDGQSVQGIFIQQAQFPAELSSRLLRRIARLIGLTLAEYEMSKIVE